MRNRYLSTVVCGAVALVALGCVAPSATGAGYEYPATYKGTMSTGGSVEFDVSADGNVTRFQVAGAPDTCGKLFDAAVSGEFPIFDDSFSNGNPTAGLAFTGTFRTQQFAEGTLSYRIIDFRYDGCESRTVSWSASASGAFPIPPQQPPAPPTSMPTAPQTTITSGPGGQRKSRRAVFRFRSDGAGSSFRCKLDRRRWHSCRSPTIYRRLGLGRHAFRVQAIGASQLADPTPARRRWRVMRPRQGFALTFRRRAL